MSYEKRPRFEVTIFAEPGGHAARLLQTDRWCVSSTLHAAIEAEVAERVAEALRAQLPDDAPELPAKNLEDITFRDWLRSLNEWTRWLSWLCTEPPELTMPMRARREWRRCLRNADNTCGPERLAWKCRATSLELLLTNSGEPL